MNKGNQSRLQIKMVIEVYFFVLNKKAHCGDSLELPQQWGFNEYKFYMHYSIYITTSL